MFRDRSGHSSSINNLRGSSREGAGFPARLAEVTPEVTTPAESVAMYSPSIRASERQSRNDPRPPSCRFIVCLRYLPSQDSQPFPTKAGSLLQHRQAIGTTHRLAPWHASLRRDPENTKC
ncbi:hypothetical protein DPMN_189146 [Dreissena polymorpha]|uniref:Uncharacterized protein n=1 Tax=Dreissena polymorpha TaxID=45954 RepID=A0A9D4DTJ9_DREPO|nr:hypothetical protein DPMN_189146 [Dreissena polymorpha]